MPIKVPNDLPAIDTLTKENVFVMTDTRAMTQDVRPLHILLLNLMPTKIDTETQLARLLGNTPLQIELELLQTATHKAHNVSQEHMIAFYKTFSEIQDEYFDGMIITGAPVEKMEFEEVDYWEELCEIMEWSKTHVHSTFHICWGAQAGLYYHYGIQKHMLPKKLSGVYLHHLDQKHGMLFRGFDDEFYVPHSRNTTVYREDIEAVPELKVLASSEEAGVFCVKSTNDRQIFVTGHSEYDWNTLLKEYVRDKNAGLNPDVPDHYFPNDDDTQMPIVKWRSCANLIYSNWINYFVYQSTPYDIHMIDNEDLAPVLKNNSDLTVAKFGGTSLADTAKFRQVKSIVQEDPARKYIVASAAGRSAENTVKVTDLLIEAAKKPEKFDENIKLISDRYCRIAEDLDLAVDISAKINRIREDFREIREGGGNPLPYLASRGEYLCAQLLAEYLGYDFVDGEDLILFHNDGTLNLEATRNRIAEVLKDREHAVIPGFYGRTEDGRIYTFSRGGSDITGSLVAEAVKADLYENWTDVPGMLMADPKVVKNPLSVPVINYRELRELSLCGAEVLHEDAVAPARRRGIPINIRSTSEPQKPGTLIVKNADFYQTVLDISGISGKTGYCSVLIERERLTEDPAMKTRIDEVFRNHGLEISAEQIALDSVSLVVNASSFRDCEEQVIQELHDLTGAEDIDVSTGLATIAVVGRNISKTVSVSLRIFEALANEHINLRFADHGAERISMQIGVNESDYKNAIRAIYKAFTNVSQLSEK